MRPREHNEDAQAFVPREAVVGACRYEGRLPFLNGKGLSLDREHAPALQNDVELVVLVRLLAIRLRRNEDVDPDLQPRRAVNDLVAAVAGSESLPHAFYVEWMHQPTLTESAEAIVHLAKSRTRLSALTGALDA
jgi:hypothetical protein